MKFSNVNEKSLENSNFLKKVLPIIMLLLISQSVLADNIIILNLRYEDGKLTVVDKENTYGYAPDRRIQPETGYTAEIISRNGDVLYSFRFEIPTEHYTDIEIGNETKGGLILIDETDFALIIPAFPDAKEIRFYNQAYEDALSVGLVEEQPRVFPIIALIGVIAIIALYIILRKRKS